VRKEEGAYPRYFCDHPLWLDGISAKKAGVSVKKFHNLLASLGRLVTFTGSRAQGDAGTRGNPVFCAGRKLLTCSRSAGLGIVCVRQASHCCTGVDVLHGL
jgi:hypothetical protein